MCCCNYASFSAVNRMARLVFRKRVRSSYVKGFLIGSIVLLMLFIQNDIALRKQEKNTPWSNDIYTQERHLNSEKKDLQNITNSKLGSTLQHSKKTQHKLFLQHENDWKEVYGSNREYFVYSAYYDTRQPKKYVVRIIAIIQKRIKIRQCQLYYEDGSSEQVSATSTTIKEGWSLKYIASFVLCDASNRGYSPAWVSLLNKDGVILQPNIKVVDLTKRVHEGFVSVCVKPFHYEYNRALWLVEFIEFHRLLGVEKFFFYNHTVGIDVEDILKYYIESSVVTVLPWNLPVKSQTEIRTEGIFAALNDCNLRNVGRYNYTIMIDLDEYIIPRKHNNYKEMLHELGRHNAYVVQNVFYYMYWENDTTISKDLYSETGIGTQLYGSEDVGPYLLTAYKTFRSTKINKFGQRSKYIADPQKVIECGNHVAWKYADANKGLKVDTEIALMNHYRICEGGGFECISRPRELDRAAHKWLIPLMEKVSKICSMVFLQDNLCPPAPELGNPW